MDEDIEEQLQDVKIPRYVLPAPTQPDSDESSDEFQVDGGLAGAFGSRRPVQETQAQERYKGKYVKLKRQIKELMFENAALCDEVSETNEKINLFKEQRLLLLQRLLEKDKEMESQYVTYQTRWMAENGAPVVPQKRKYRKRSVVDGAVPPKVKGKKQLRPEVKQEVVDIKLTPSGQPICPFTIDGFTVHCLGHVVFTKNSYHTNEYIYPVGFNISRVYGHFKDPERKCVYTCRVLENGEFPRFEIVANDSEPRFRISGPSPDYCHTTLLQYINSANSRNVDIRPQGESFFGLSNPTIASLIAKLPNAEKCVKYAPKKEAKPGETTDASLSYEALQRHMNLSTYRIPEIKEEPPEDLFDLSDIGFQL